MKPLVNNFNKRDYVQLVLLMIVYYTLWKIIKQLNFIWLYKNNIPTFGKVDNPNDYIDVILVDWIVVIAFMSGIAYLVYRWFNTRNLKLHILIPVHFLLSFLMGFFIFPSQFLVYYLQDRISFDDGFFNVLLDRVIKYMDTNFLTYFSMLGIILLFYYFKGIKNEESKKARLESQLLEARIAALNSQLQPHFIFNTLNGISSLIDEDSERAQKMLTYLGDLLRNVLKKNQEDLVDLESELRNIENYLQIQKIRFEENLKVEMSIEKGIGKIMVPNLFIQPIIENAIKHGYGYRKKELTLAIAMFQDKNFLNIRIANNGLPLETVELIAGNGLRILRERFNLHYGDNFSFEIKNLMDKDGVENLIKIPK